jgi:hypothetical protein
MVKSPTKQKQAEIFINKIEAARRQIDAAIRMKLAKEDALAIHTVASADYRVLRDLLEKRGKFDLDEILRFGIFAFASQIARGDSADARLNQLFPIDSAMWSLIEQIAVQIKAEGEKFDVKLISMKLSQQQKHDDFIKSSQTFNFLKHADRDHLQLISVDNIDNDELLIRASAAYKMIMQELTAEMSVHKLMYFSATSQLVDQHDEDDRDIVVKLAELSDSRQKGRTKANSSVQTFAARERMKLISFSH